MASVWCTAQLTRASWLTILPLLLVLDTGQGFQCGVCDRSSCLPPGECPGGLVIDACGCCAVCGRVEREECGGPQWGPEPPGVCAPGFICKVTALGEGDSITGLEVGHCHAVPTGLVEVHSTDLDCDQTECDVALPKEDCPADSYLQGPITQPGQCCPKQMDPPCQCLPCLDQEVTCEKGQIKVKVTTGNGEPGQCCDMYKCLPREIACSNITCPDSSNVTSCPPDSTPLPPKYSHGGCCEEPLRCVCLPEWECRKRECGEGKTARWVEKATGIPGNCCDLFECIDADPPTGCRHDGTLYEEGISWSLDHCTTCTCTGGLTLCSVVTCPEMENPACDWMVVPQGQCCPVCKGCIDDQGDLHFNGDTWAKDDCVTCKCVDGQYYCQAQACMARCAHPRKVPGICCPVCDDLSTEVTMLPPCEELRNCTLICDEGLLLDDKGCPMCQCAPQSATDCEMECLNIYHSDSSGEVDCDCDDVIDHMFVPHDPKRKDCGLLLDCPHGYKTDSHGIWQCECIELPPIEGPFEPPEDCPSLFCPYGFMVNETGHHLCHCEEPPVLVLPQSPTENPESLCPMLNCPHGLKTDINGLEICECWEPPLMEIEVTSPAPERCPIVIGCNIQCMYGLRTDKNGCVKCKCRKCPVLECNKKCFHGYRVNSHGCRICKCLESPAEPNITESPLTVELPSRGRCMSMDGRDLEDGQMTYDGCRRCFCFQGVEMCSLITCQAPRCQHPVVKAGDCCPSCPDEDSRLSPIPNTKTKCVAVDGTPLVEGETWDMDSCTQCICHQGEPLCQVEHCPPVLCIHPVKLSGKCCASCPGDGSDPFPLDPSYHHRRLCRSPSGATYLSGDTWRVGPCQSCLCREGQVHCFVQTCPILDCNETVLKKGQCCPRCLVGSTALIPHPRLCVHDGSSYGPHESWLLDECTRCICYQGNSVCASIKCQDPAPCPHPIKVPGHCCPVCANITEPRLKNKGRGKSNSINRDHYTHDHHDHTQHYITVGVLVVVVLLLGSMVILLLFLLLRKKRRTSHTTQTHGDICRRPKSTNLDYMGVNPLMGDPMKGKLLCDPVKQALLEDASNKSVMLGSETKLPLEESTKDMSMENGGVNLHLLAKNSPSHNEETVNNAALSNDKSSLRYSMVDETSKALLELPDLQCDTNNYRKSL